MPPPPRPPGCVPSGFSWGVSLSSDPHVVAHVRCTPHTLCIVDTGSRWTMALAYMCPPGGPSQYPHAWTPHHRRHALLHKQGQDSCRSALLSAFTCLEHDGSCGFHRWFSGRKGRACCFAPLKISFKLLCSFHKIHSLWGCCPVSCPTSFLPCSWSPKSPVSSTPHSATHPSPNGHQQDRSLS